jgi:murein DD-endopeptidase MepM/ murein hydrolase activator NlpD
MAKSFKTNTNKSLKSKFRFVILNDETFEEKFSLILSRTNVWVFASTIAVTLIFFTAAAIIYTPVKYFIPGFGDYRYKSQILRMQAEVDSLQTSMEARAEWLQNITDIASGKLDSTRPVITKDGNIDKSKIDINKVSELELELRKEVEEEENFSLSAKGKGSEIAIDEVRQMHLLSPVTGYVTDSFSPLKEHFGIDIAAPNDAPVKATLDGRVISTGWTLETGYVIAIQHTNNLVSFYKHNGRLLKKTGAAVKAGEVIAVVGNTGELTTGPHLHFELWREGKSLNPQDYILF